MKRLLGLLLVGCGPSEEESAAAALEKLGYRIQLRNKQGEAVLVRGPRKVTDAGLVHLKGLTRLQVLYLGDTKVSDAGVAEVQDREVARAAPNLALGLTASSHFHSLVPRDCLHLAQDVVNH